MEPMDQSSLYRVLFSPDHVENDSERTASLAVDFRPVKREKKILNNLIIMLSRSNTERRLPSRRVIKPMSGIPCHDSQQWTNNGMIRHNCDNDKQLLGWKFSSVLLRLLWSSRQASHRILLHFKSEDSTLWRQMLLGRNCQPAYRLGSQQGGAILLDEHVAYLD
ncbi:hypothetical protein BJX76DRAFT_182156 [Aspergillus varians]